MRIVMGGDLAVASILLSCSGTGVLWRNYIRPRLKSSWIISASDRDYILYSSRMAWQVLIRHNCQIKVLMRKAYKLQLSGRREGTVAKASTLWSALNKLQLGRYAEYFVKMEFTRLGFQVYSSEVDDRGIDFVVRHQDGPFFEVQVKSTRGCNYIFVPKDKSRLDDSRLVAVALFGDSHQPELFLIAMTVWRDPDGFFVDRNYEGKRSKPEWGINLSKSNMHRLRVRFAFGAVAQRIVSTGRAT